MAIEAHDPYSGIGVIESRGEGFVGNPHAQVQGILRKEGPEDALRRLLGELVAVHAEAGVAQDRGDEVSAGDFSLPRYLGGAVEIPARA